MKHGLSKLFLLPNNRKVFFFFFFLSFLKFHLFFTNFCILKNAGDLGEINDEENVEHKRVNSSHAIAASISGKVVSVDSSSLHESLFVQNPVTVKVECADNYVESSSANCMNIASLAGIQAINSEPETSEEFLDELDHVVLKERLRRLLTRFHFFCIIPS